MFKHRDKVMDCKFMYVFTILTLLLKLVVAGNNSFNMENKIYNGYKAEIKKFSYALFLFIKCEGYCICGASIINQIIILTAAHCLEDCNPRRPDLVEAHLGNGNREKGVILELVKFKLHEKYDKVEVSADIAVATLKRPVKLGATMSRVSIVNLYPPYDAPATVFGWGFTYDGDDEGSVDLMYTTQEVWSIQSCERVLGTISPNTICAAPTEDDNGYPGRGDSGGALVVHDYIQIGLVSHNVPSISESLSVYTDVGKYVDWISHNANEMYCGNNCCPCG